MTKNKSSKAQKEKAVILERRFVPKGKIIVQEGEFGITAFLIQSGKVSVYTEARGKKIELARMGVGQIFGEMALIFDQPRTATVEAIEDCNLIVLTRRVLQQKLEKSDPTVRAIVPMLMKRVLDTSNALIKRSDDIDDLLDSVNLIYQNSYSQLEGDKKKAFQDKVGPKLEAFLNSVKEFRESP
jgi:CRP-like cAMP-binding protein